MFFNHSLPGFTTHANRPEEVMLEVVFGTPSKQCRGLGICMIVEPIHFRGRATKCPHIPGYFRLDTGRKMLLARFDETYLSSQMISRHFSGGLFKVTESFKVPGRFCRMLGAGCGLIIGEGAYRSVHDGTYRTVVFDAPGLIFSENKSNNKIRPMDCCVC